MTTRCPTPPFPRLRLATPEDVVLRCRLLRASLAHGRLVRLLDDLRTALADLERVLQECGHAR